MAQALLIIVVAYLLGSIPVGYLIVRARGGVDVRKTGSGGTGATNVSRQAGKFAGVLTLLLDALKGSLAVLFAQWIVGGSSGTSTCLVAAAVVAVMIGHCFPVWLGFRGGKGVATGLGAFLVIAPIAVALAAVVFLCILVLTRYVSLASITATALIPFFMWLETRWTSSTDDLTARLSAGLAAAALILFAHRANIARLVAGTETKFK
jgi:glycerol-3-phosphate acyltransferase PlsY